MTTPITYQITNPSNLTERPFLPGSTPTSPLTWGITPPLTTTLANGAVTPSPEDTIRDFLNPAFQGPNWDSLIAALSTGDIFETEFAQEVFNQLFISTASGIYLDRKLEDLGIVKPQTLGIPDDVFRQLGISINAHKLTLESLLEVLDIYYGDDALRASVDSSINQPYNIPNGANLQLLMENIPVSVIFNNQDFANPSQATALEVATVINRYFEANGFNDFAKPITNALTGNTFIRIYSGALGLKGRIQVVGGQAQNILQFPTVLATTQAVGTTWIVDTSASLSSETGSTVRFTYTGTGTNPTLQLVQIGDYVTVYGSIWSANNLGTFVITNVTTTYFEIINTIGIAQSAIAQVTIQDLAFYRPKLFTINNKPRRSLVAQGIPNETDVILAATTQAVGRKPFEAAYLQGNSSFTLTPKLVQTIGSLTRIGGNTVTVTTTNNHNLLLNDQVYLSPGEPNFPQGIKTVSLIVNNTTFQYTEIGSNTSSVKNNVIYPNFRDTTGTIHLTTINSNNFSANQFIFVDNLINDINSVGQIGFNSTINSSGSTLTFRQAVLLQNGNVLVCGGQTSGATKSNLTYLYNIATNTWSNGPNMNTARSQHTATVLNDGRVLVVGGASSNAVPEFYYPNLNIWVNGPPNVVARTNHCATLLNNGNLLIVGGGSSTYEIFTISTENWSSASTPYDVQGSQAILLQNGNVLVPSGYNGSSIVNTALLFNPVISSWRTTVNNMTTGVQYYEAINLKIGTSGKVYVIGGSTTTGGAAFNGTQIFDPSQETWATGPNLNTARYSFGLANLWNNQLIVYGGNTTSSTDVSSSEILDYINGTSWILNSAPALDQYGVEGISLGNNGVLFAAGISASSTSVDYLYTPQNINIATNSGRINGFYPINNITSNNQFTYITKDFTSISTINTQHVDNQGNLIIGSVTPFKAVLNPEHFGPYLMNVKDGFAITGTITTTNQLINSGASYSILNVTNATNFPTSGYLIFNFGYSNQSAPVQYFAKASNTQLIINSNFKFPFTLPVGTPINLLYSNSPFIPTTTNLGAFYLTDSTTGRITAENTINDIAAAGVIINTTINYPGSIGLGNSQQPTNIITPKVNDIVYIFGNENDVLVARGAIPSGVESTGGLNDAG